MRDNYLITSNYRTQTGTKGFPIVMSDLTFRDVNKSNPGHVAFYQL